MIDKPYVIDRETVKSLLQISGTTYDSLIDLYLPIVSEDIESICNQCFVKEYKGTLTNTSAIITDIVLSKVFKGWLVSTDNFDNAIITDADIEGYTLTTDTESTETLKDSTVYINQFPIAKRIVISQMIAFQMVKNNGINTVTNGSVKSKSLPPLSVSYSDIDNALTTGYGYPSYMIASLQQIRKPRFI